MKIKIGPAGTGGNAVEGLKKISDLNLNSCEIEFTYGVRMTNTTAKEVGKLAKKLNIALSVHAPYYINLNSKEKAKIIASKKRILQSCERGNYLGAKHIVFHAGFYSGMEKERAYNNIKEQISDLQKEIKKNRWNVILAPETTGKASQFGDLDELLKLMKDTKCDICIDFAHLKARNNGRIDYDQIFKKLKPLKHIHSHFSGVEWTAKGERRHLLTETKDIKELISYIKKYKVDITVINESPDPFGDSLKTKRLL